MNIIISIAILLIKKQKLKQVTLNIFFLMIDRPIIITIMRVVHIETMIVIQKRQQLYIQNHKLKQIIKKYLFQRI